MFSCHVTSLKSNYLKSNLDFVPKSYDNIFSINDLKYQNIIDKTAIEDVEVGSDVTEIL